MITLNSGAHHTEKRQSISSGSMESLKLKIMKEIQLKQLYEHGTLCTTHRLR